MTPFMPVYFGKSPAPYYEGNDNERLLIHPPVFRSVLYDLPFDEFRGVPNAGFSSFCARVSLPLLAHDLSNMTRYQTARQLGLVPDPTTDREGVIRTAYEEIEKTCRDNGALMIVVVLGNSARPVEIPGVLRTLDAQMVDAQQVLIDRLKSGDDYDKEYKHWRGRPLMLVDGHPNAHAHAIIAGEIVKAIHNSPSSLAPPMLP